MREKVNAHISVGERLHTRWEILPILENHLTDYLMPDVTWTGGITELKKIATLAEAFYIPVSPHDASGPINVVAGAHVMMSTPNFYRLETSRWDLSNYNNFITAPLDNSDGRLKVSPKPGLGIEMNMDFLRGNLSTEPAGPSRNVCPPHAIGMMRPVLVELDSHRRIGAAALPRQDATAVRYPAADTPP